MDRGASVPGTRRFIFTAYRLSLLLALVACVVVGRWTREPAQPAHLLDVDEAFDVAGRSESVAQVVASGAARPMMMIDRQSEQFFDVLVGEDLGTRVSRWSTLRVDRRSGMMWRLSRDAAGAETWLPESMIPQRRTS